MSDNIEWDAPMEEEEQKAYGPLPKGDYRFAVYQKPIVPVNSKGDKTMGAPMAKLELALFAIDDTEYDKQIGIAFDNLIRHKSTEWKVCQFFAAIGERKHGEKIAPKWDMVPGATGIATCYPETYEGKTNMKVERYVVPTEEGAPLPF